MLNLYPELENCRICPRACGINRYKETGYCLASADIKVNLHQLHFGEEPVISGTHGSGTIFFSHCNLKCIYCQNYTISNEGNGNIVSEEQCLNMMLNLQEQGAHNINLVTPTHYSIQLARILHKAKLQGLRIPVVWNSNAYESVDTLKRLDGLVDIYLPDLKYASAKNSELYSHAADYPEFARQAIKEMHRQVGYLKCDENTIGMRGLLIRLLVLPDNIAGVSESLEWINAELGNETSISLMAQYYPAWQATNYKELNRGINDAEYNEVLKTLERFNFNNGFTQELSCSDVWTPDFIQTDTK